MKRLLLVAQMILGAALFAACGDDDTNVTPDAGMAKCNEVGGEACFVEPTEALRATDGYTAGQPNLVDPDFNCGAPMIQTSTMPIVVSGVIEDFQNGGDQPVGLGTIEAFTGLDFTTPFAMDTADIDGNFEITLPAGALSRMNWRMKGDGWLDTYALNISLDITQAAVTESRGAVSEDTAGALPAFIGVTRTAGLGVLAGVAMDCAGNELSNAIATISTTSSAGGAEPAHVAGAQTYYFSCCDTELPARRNLYPDSTANGLFVIIEIPPTAAGETYYLQTWGFKTAADLAAGTLTLLSEIESPVFADSVISVDMSPNQGQ